MSCSVNIVWFSQVGATDALFLSCKHFWLECSTEGMLTWITTTSEKNLSHMLTKQLPRAGNKENLWQRLLHSPFSNNCHSISNFLALSLVFSLCFWCSWKALLGIVVSSFVFLKHASYPPIRVWFQLTPCLTHLFTQHMSQVTFSLNLTNQPLLAVFSHRTCRIFAETASPGCDLEHTVSSLQPTLPLSQNHHVFLNLNKPKPKALHRHLCTQGKIDILHSGPQEDQIKDFGWHSLFFNSRID